MLNKKMVEDLKTYIGVGGMLIIVTVTIMGVSFLFFPNENMVGAIIQFIGSIIGGALTLVGVQMTISKQDRDDFEKRYFREMKIIDSFLDKVSKVADFERDYWQLDKLEKDLC
ncbi:hypothetical protein C1X05_15175 [Laceyella sacchari]|nr:hypothetical protein C1X05_15175 [Laceyella sacchari]